VELLVLIAAGSAIGAIVAAVVAAQQAAFAKRQAVAAEEQARAAKMQAELAIAELAKIEQAKREEKEHADWLEHTLVELRKQGAEAVLVAPGDHLHAGWAEERGSIRLLDTARGPAAILPAAELWGVPGSPEAQLHEARGTILTECASQPGAWKIWSRDATNPWEAYLAAAQQLDAEGLVTAKVSGSRTDVAVRITVDGTAAVRRGAF